MREQVLAVQRMQDLLGEHPERELTLGDLARVSLYSPWYSYRLFREFTGLTPADYQRRLRLSRSALRLKEGGCRVIDAAMELDFGSVDGYTRAFRRAFGVSPGEYARNPVPIPLFVPYGAKFRELRKETISMKDIRNVFIQTVRRPARKAIVKRGAAAAEYFAYCGEVGCDVWGLLLSMDSLAGEPVGLWLPEAYREPGTSVYVQGVEVPEDSAAPVPEGFDVIPLPEAEYLMFQGEPFAEEDYREAILAVQQAMDRYAPRPSAGPGMTASPASSWSPRAAGATSSSGPSGPSEGAKPPEERRVLRRFFLSCAARAHTVTWGLVYCPCPFVRFPYWMANFGQRCRQPRHITHFSFPHTGLPSRSSMA